MDVVSFQFDQTVNVDSIKSNNSRATLTACICHQASKEVFQAILLAHNSRPDHTCHDGPVFHILHFFNHQACNNIHCTSNVQDWQHNQMTVTIFHQSFIHRSVCTRYSVTAQYLTALLIRSTNNIFNKPGSSSSAFFELCSYPSITSVTDRPYNSKTKVRYNKLYFVTGLLIPLKRHVHAITYPSISHQHVKHNQTWSPHIRIHMYTRDVEFPDFPMPVRDWGFPPPIRVPLG